MFIAIHHNVTNTTEDPTAVIKYTTGFKDICAVFFYFLITIIMHAVLQEYIFDVCIFDFIYHQVCVISKLLSM